MENREAPVSGPYAARIERMAERPLQPRSPGAANTPYVSHSPSGAAQQDEEPLPSGKQRTAVAKARYAAAAKAKRAAQRDAEEEAKRAEERDAVGERG